MKHNFAWLLLATIVLYCPVFTYAQNDDTLEIQKNESGRISFARFKSNRDRKIKDAVDFLHKVLLH